MQARRNAHELPSKRLPETIPKHRPHRLFAGRTLVFAMERARKPGSIRGPSSCCATREAHAHKFAGVDIIGALEDSSFRIKSDRVTTSEHAKRRERVQLAGRQ